MPLQSQGATHPRRILLAEDEANVRRVIAAHLRRAGYEILEAEDAPTAQRQFQEHDVDLVLTDLKMPDSEQDGLELLKFVVQRAPRGRPRVPVLILTAHGTADKAIEALSQGAYNLISKPCDMDELLAQVANALRERDEANETFEDPSALTGRFGIVGRTDAMRRVFDTIERVADTPSTVLITGESGTGKELVARAIHGLSSRSRKAMVGINCAAIPEELLESELFGYEKGAFTGATTSKPGKFELAEGGTLFLDEVAELKLGLQVKLLRCLQEREIVRVGGTTTIRVDTRVIAATNRNLAEEVAAGRFREDLYYRLNVVPIHLPPLRERIEDLPLLVDFFVKKYNRRLGKSVAGVDRTLLEAFERYPWPGNIRELENVLERMVLFSDSNRLSVRHLPPELMTRLKEAKPLPESPGRGGAAQWPSETTSGVGASQALPATIPLKKLVREKTLMLERDLIVRTLNETGWNVTRTARRLGLSRKGLQMKMKELEIRKSGG